MSSHPVIKSILFTVLFPGGITVLVPYILLILDSNRLDLSFIKYLGIPVVILGIIFYSMSVLSFINLGGTPQIYFMKKLEGLFGLEPNKLANTGIYRFSRNPMYTGVFLAILGEGLFFESLFILIWSLLFFVFVNFVVIFIEEPHLRAQHGEDYSNYLKTTPRWLGYKSQKKK